MPPTRQACLGNNGVKASVANVQVIENIINQVGEAFGPKSDPFQELAREIEKYSRKIWQCTGGRDGQYRQAKKARTQVVESSPKPKLQNVHQESAPVTSAVKQPHSTTKSDGGESRQELESALNALKYREIQLQCKEYGLLATGNKETLRERLLEHLLENQNQPNKNAVEPHMNQRTDPREEDMDIDDDISIDDKGTNRDEEMQAEEEVAEKSLPTKATNSTVPNAPVVEKAKEAPIANEKEEVLSSESMEVEVEATGKVDMTTTDPPGKGTSDTSSSIIAGELGSKSPLAGFVKGALQSLAKQDIDLKQQTDVAEDDTAPASSDVTTSSTSSKISGPRVRELVSKLSSNHSSQQQSSSSALSNKLQAKKDARMARLAEMRGKANLGKTTTASVTKGVPSSSKDLSKTLPSVAVTDSASSTGGKKNLAAQMREKALRKENVPVNQAQNQYGSSVKRNFGLSSSVVMDALGSTLKSGGLGSTLKSFSATKQPKKKPPSPSETYEISDREDSDSDDSEAENEKSKKRIPDWARREQLLPALEAQYIGKGMNGHKADPDQIFGEVQTCDLEAIFGSRKNAKYRNRTSSGNWSRDKVTAAEKLVYKRTMGFAETSEI